MNQGSMWRTLLSLMVVMVLTVQGKEIDIRREVATIVRQHNNERRSRQLRASNMMELQWDESLARQASQFAQQCRYERPDRYQYDDVGSNLYFEGDFVHSHKSIHRLVNRALRSWKMHSNQLGYSKNCGRACSYAQMIYATTSRIGCALQTCRDLQNGNRRHAYSSVLVCFYFPKAMLMASFPYKMGRPCSECPTGWTCREGLCAQRDSIAIPNYNLEKDRPQRLVSGPDKDTLTSSESYYLASAHNRMREGNRRDPLETDPYLQRWASWIVSCEADYPGPKHCYTNFHRLDQNAQVYDVVSEWSSEGDVTNIQLEHGCRTPYDQARCNHFTNILQPMITSMACAAKDCKDGTRQLVCIYDNKVDRAYTGRRSRPSPIRTRPRDSRGRRRSNQRRRNRNNL